MDANRLEECAGILAGFQGFALIDEPFVVSLRDAGRWGTNRKGVALAYKLPISGLQRDTRYFIALEEGVPCFVCPSLGEVTVIWELVPAHPIPKAA